VGVIRREEDEHGWVGRRGDKSPLIRQVLQKAGVARHCDLELVTTRLL